MRSRTEDDLEACVQMAEAVHALDGYPPYLPHGDLGGFLADGDALAAWVALAGSDVVGHVALHTRSSRPVMEMATARLGTAPERLGVVARLLVAPDARRSGVGRALLDTAARRARSLGREPILDVGVLLTKAVALYEAAGWNRLGQVSVTFRDGTRFDEFVYAGPGD